MQTIPAHGGLKEHDHNQADHLLLEALCANLLPSSLVDSPEFRCFLECISCGAYVPHRTKMTELIDAKYEEALSKVCSYLVDLDKAHASLYTILNILYFLV